MIVCMDVRSLICKKCGKWTDSKEFMGHYILVVGYKEGIVYYKDSGKHTCETCFMILSLFEKSRKSFDHYKIKKIIYSIY